MKKWIIIIVGSLLFIVVFALMWLLVYFNTNLKQQVYILPENFNGLVLIVYDQKDGLDDVIEDGRLIYAIPKSGVLKLKRNEAVKLSQSWYYFEDAHGMRTEFYYCSPPCVEMKADSTKVFAFGRSNGASLDGNYALRRTVFLVGTANDIDSLNREYEKLNAIEVIRNTN